jgi:hypothetical protein
VTQAARAFEDYGISANLLNRDPLVT